MTNRHILVSRSPPPQRYAPQCELSVQCTSTSLSPIRWRPPTHQRVLLHARFTRSKIALRFLMSRRRKHLPRCGRGGAGGRDKTTQIVARGTKRYIQTRVCYKSCSESVKREQPYGLSMGDGSWQDSSAGLLECASIAQSRAPTK